MSHNEYGQKIKKLEKYLIIKKVTSNNKYQRQVKPFNPQKLMISNETMHLRQRDLQLTVDKNFHKLISDYDYTKTEEPSSSSPFLQQFIQNRELHTIDEEKRKNRTNLRHIQTEVTEFKLPSVTKSMPRKIDSCEALMKECDSVQQGLKKVIRQQKRGQRRNNKSLNQMYNRLVCIQTSNFLQNELILL